MTRRHIVTAGIFLLALGHVAFERVALAQDSLAISPDDETVVEHYVEAYPMPPPIIEEHMTLRPGAVIPAGVPLTKFEKLPSLERYAYFVSVDHKIVVADPRTRVVVRILDQKH